MNRSLLVKHLGITDFSNTCQAMQRFTAERTLDTPDELWVTAHSAVYSLGLNRKNIRLPSRDDIPLVNTDRGGKITYHGPGQLVIYVLLDLKRQHLNIRQLVTILENALIELLARYAVQGYSKRDAPGVYVKNIDGLEAKIASLGLRVKNNYCYHGLSLNVDMDLRPFLAIDPCGYAGLVMTQTKDLGIHDDMNILAELLLEKLSAPLVHGMVHGN